MLPDNHPNYRDVFTSFYETFKTDALYHDMSNTCENSVWHREVDVGVHTTMVVEEYHKLTHEVHRWNKDHFKGALACVFHDIGKPGSKRESRDPVTGEIKNKFHGHELLSARLAEQYLVKHWDVFSGFLVPFDIYAIGWMIQNHLPYGVKKHEKRYNIKSTVSRVLPLTPKVFEYFLVSDQLGRISDNHDVKKRNVVDWIEEYDTWDQYKHHNSEHKPHFVVMIGVPNSGKTSICDTYMSYTKIDTSSIEHWLTALRGSKKLFDLVSGAVETRNNVCVDGCNLTDKHRNVMVNIAHDAGYYIEFVLFPSDASGCVDRSIFDQIQYPSYGRLCNKVSVYNGILSKRINSIK